MVTIAKDGDYKVCQISHNKIALYCYDGRYQHESPMYIADLEQLDEVVENMHFNAKMCKNMEVGK